MKAHNKHRPTILPTRQYQDYNTAHQPKLTSYKNNETVLNTRKVWRNNTSDIIGSSHAEHNLNTTHNSYSKIIAWVPPASPARREGRGEASGRGADCWRRASDADGALY